MTAPGSPSLPRLLGHNPHTVTHLLEELTGEPLVADVVRQYSLPAEAGNALGVAAGQTVTHRIAVLKGGVTAVPYVYAESAFVPARLPDVARRQLEETSDPIGRILAAHQLTYVREESSASEAGAPRALDLNESGAADASGAAGAAGARHGRCGRHCVVPRLHVDDRRPPRIRHLRMVLPFGRTGSRAFGAGLTSAPV